MKIITFTLVLADGDEDLANEATDRIMGEADWWGDTTVTEENTCPS